MLKIKSHFSGFLYLVLECYTSRIAEKNKFFLWLFFLPSSASARSTLSIFVCEQWTVNWIVGKFNRKRTQRDSKQNKNNKKFLIREKKYFCEVETKDFNEWTRNNSENIKKAKKIPRDPKHRREWRTVNEDKFKLTNKKRKFMRRI